MFGAIFSNNRLQPSLNAKLQENQNASFKKHFGAELDQFRPMVLETVLFCVYAIFSDSPCRPS